MSESIPDPTYADIKDVLESIAAINKKTAKVDAEIAKFKAYFDALEYERLLRASLKIAVKLRKELGRDL